MTKVRETFELKYGRYNDLAKNEDGAYKDWNLELTWHCWNEAWLTCLVTEHDRKLTPPVEPGDEFGCIGDRS